MAFVTVSPGGGGRVAEPAPTIYDVAERAGVSIATVSRAINALSTVRPATRDKVFRAMDELDFVPNSVARGLSIGKHGIIGLVYVRSAHVEGELMVEETSLLYTDIVIRGAEARANDLGYSLLLSSTGDSHPSDISSLLNLTGSVDGLILLDRVLNDDDVAYLARRIPVVLLAGRGDSPSAVTIRVDNEQAMRGLAEHLIVGHGIVRLGFVGGAEESPDTKAREFAFQEAIVHLGGTLSEVDIVRSDWTTAGSETMMAARLRLDDELPQVFACANDQMAVGVIFALRAAGLRVPDDIAVTGFDDITLTRYFNPPLTTIRQSGGILGAVAVDALIATLNGRTPEQRTIVMPTELVVRGSCGCVSDPEDALRSLHSPARTEVGV